MEFFEECYEGEHDWDQPENLGNDIWRVTWKRCGEEWEELLIVEYWKRKTITILGKKYPALKAWGNISLCSDWEDEEPESCSMGGFSPGTEECEFCSWRDICEEEFLKHIKNR